MILLFSMLCFIITNQVFSIIITDEQTVLIFNTNSLVKNNRFRKFNDVIRLLVRTYIRYLSNFEYHKIIQYYFIVKVIDDLSTEYRLNN